MPLILEPYDTIRGKTNKTELPVSQRMYEDFGKKIIALLQSRIEGYQDIAECTLMANINTMGRFLGNEFEIFTLPRSKKYPRSSLKRYIGSKRSTCVLSGVNRFILVRDKNLPR